MKKSFNLERIKSDNDCRQIVNRDLGRPAYHGEKCDSWACPFHHEHKGHSLLVFADGWRCVGKCNTAGDQISWVMRFHGLDFKDACAYLGGVEELVSQVNARRAQRLADTKPQQPVEPFTPPDEHWQQSIRAVAMECADLLWSEQGSRALDWLRARGLTDETIRAAQLGFMPGNYTDWPKAHGMSIPAGITIPWFYEDQIMALHVRRAAGDDKYPMVKGGKLSKAMYWVDHFVPGRPTLIVEGEFDNLVTWQEAGDLVNVITIGGASNSVHPHWYPYLATAPKLFAATDNDGAGEIAGQKLAEKFGHLQRVHVPASKDANDYHKTGPGNLRKWVLSLIGPDNPSPVQACDPDLPPAAPVATELPLPDEPKTSTVVDTPKPMIQRFERISIWELHAMVMRGEKVRVIDAAWGKR